MLQSNSALFSISPVSFLSWADLEGVQGVATPLNSHSIKYSAVDVLSQADTLIYIAKGLVVVVVTL